MESTLSLQTNLYPHITPAGAFYAIANKSVSASRTLLSNILKADSQQPITQEKLLEWSETSDIESALNLLYRLQRLEFLYGGDTPEENFELRRYFGKFIAPFVRQPKKHC